MNKLDQYDVIRLMVKVGTTNPGALTFLAQLLGYPPCPKCGFVQKKGDNLNMFEGCRCPKESI